MLCEKCGKKSATAFFSQNINGKEETYGLCSRCASEYYHNGINSFALDFSNLLSLAFSQNKDSLTQTESSSTVIRCPECSATFREIVNAGKVGCGRCYVTFRNQLMPSIQKIHGKTEHVGKISVNVGEKMKRESLLRQLREELSDAVKEQNFESAAMLRDKIKNIEDGEE